MDNLSGKLEHFNRIGYAVIVFDLNGTIVYLNKTSEQLYEWGKAEICGKNIFELKLDINSNNKIDKLISEFDLKYNIFENHLLSTKSGKSLDIHSNYSPVTDDSNNIISILRIDSYRFENEILQKELRQSKENFELFFNTIDVYLFVLDNNGNIQQVNKSVIDRLGYTEEELIGKSILNIHPEDRRNEAGETVARMLKGEVQTCFVPLQAKNGGLISVATYVSQGEWNGSPAIYGVSKDITLIKQSEEKFSKVFHRNVAAMALTSITENKFVDVNEAFLDLLGYKIEEVIGKTPTNVNILKNPEDREKAIKAIQENGYFKNFEVEIQTKSGEEKIGLFYGEVINVGKDTLLLTECIDITERKKVEMVIRESEDNLRLLNSEKDKFFSIIAHDLKSPFNSLLGLTDLLVKGISTYSITDLQKMSEKLHISALKLYNLLSNLLEWSMVQRNQTKHRPEYISLNKLISECVNNEMQFIEAKDIIIETNLEDNLFVFADMRMIESTIRNLLSNAVKFTNRKGMIKVTAVKTEDKFVKVCVCDNGIGLSEEMKENIFNLNSDVHRPGTENEPSTGLGLLLCKDFVEKNGGSIWVESEEGKGSKFCFKLMSHD